MKKLSPGRKGQPQRKWKDLQKEKKERVTACTKKRGFLSPGLLRGRPSLGPRQQLRAVRAGRRRPAIERGGGEKKYGQGEPHFLACKVSLRGASGEDEKKRDKNRAPGNETGEMIRPCGGVRRPVGEATEGRKKQRTDR